MSSVTSALIKEILDKAKTFFEHAGLKPFLLALPLEGPSAKSNRDGIREKILKNKCPILYEKNDTTSTRQVECVDTVTKIINNLSDPNAIGFILLITEYVGENAQDHNINTQYHNNCTHHQQTPAYQHRPVAGGIVEFVDEYERAIRAMWCRRSLPETVAEAIMKVLTIQLIAYAFNCEHPKITSKNRISNKLLSAVDKHCLAFPSIAYSFLTESSGLNLGKHWETPEHGGNHNDSPQRKCPCIKLSSKEDAFQFWGISETRFISAWNNKKDNLIPISCPAEFDSLFKLSYKRRFDKMDVENQKNTINKIRKL